MYRKKTEAASGNRREQRLEEAPIEQQPNVATVSPAGRPSPREKPFPSASPAEELAPGAYHVSLTEETRASGPALPTPATATGQEATESYRGQTQSTNSTNLSAPSILEAELVEDPLKAAAAAPLIIAQPEPQRKPKDKRLSRDVDELRKLVHNNASGNRSLIVCLAVLLFILIAGGVAIALTFSSGRKSTPLPTPSPISISPRTPLPTPHPNTPAPVVETLRPTPSEPLTRQDIEIDIMMNSPTTKFEDPDSAQNRALEWLVGDFFSQGLMQSGELTKLRQRFGLAVLYFATEGLNWRSRDRWLSATDECVGWYGVVCSDDRVSTINQQGNRLEGTIPVELLLFTKDSVVVFNLARNDLVRTIPSELGEMPRLTDLRLHENELVGTIPTEIANLSSLRRLALTLNRLTGTVPSIPNMAQLTYLDIRDNTRLRGPLPNSLDGLDSIVDIFLFNTDLTGSLSSDLCDTLNRAFIDCGDIKCSCCTADKGVTCPTSTPTKAPTSPRPTGSPLSQPFSSPSARPNGFPSSLPPGSSSARPNGFPSSTPVGSTSRQPTGFPSHVPSLQPSLTPITFPTSSPLSPTAGPAAMTISAEPSMSPTTVASTVASASPSSGEFYSQLPSVAIATDVGLLDIVLQHVKLSAIENSESPAGRAFNWLERKDTFAVEQLEANNTVSIVQRFALAVLYFALDGPSSWSERGWLGAQENECEDWNSDDIGCNIDGAVDRLDLTNLKGFQVGQPLPDEIGLLTSLTYLSAANNTFILGNITTALGKLRLLQEFYIQGSGLVVLPTEMGLLTDLTALDTRFREDAANPVPSEIGLLTNLESLFLGGYEFENGDTIPTEIGSLESLESLILPENLEGSIPSEMGRLTELRELEIRRNNFFGTDVPTELGLLTLLRKLTLEKNSLSPSLPPLQNFAELTSLSLRFHSMNQTFPPDITLLTKLQVLDLKATSVFGPLPTSMDQLAKLSYLDLTENQNLSGVIPDQLCSTLETALIDGCTTQNSTTQLIDCDCCNVTEQCSLL